MDALGNKCQIVGCLRLGLIKMVEEKWQVLGQKVVLEHPFLRVTMEEVQLPDGRIIADWPIVAVRDYVNVVVTNEAGQVMMVEGYKHGPGRSSWQVVGGYLEAGEEPLQTAQRELLEETGYVSHDWQHLGSFVMDANRRVAMGHFYLARQARPVTAPFHNDLEQFTVNWLSVAEVAAGLSSGRVMVISYAINLALALPLLQANQAQTP